MTKQAKIEGTFYPLTADVARTLRGANLTAAEWRLWSYLIELDPWGDRYSNLPDALTIMQECGLKKSTFYKAISKFQNLELFDFQALWMSFRNLFGIPKIRTPFRENGNLSENSETIPKNRKTVRENGNLSENSDSQQPYPLPNKESSSSQTIQTIQTSHTLQIAEEKEIEVTTNVIKESGASTEVLLAEEINNNSSLAQEKGNFGKDNNSGGCSILVTNNKQEQSGSTNVGTNKYKGPKPTPLGGWRWLPEGPWNIDGKLDHNFQEWLAKKWAAKHGDDIYEARANVLLHFKKDLNNLAAWWDSYSSQYIDKAKNFKTRIDHGCKISDEEKQQAIANARAVLPMSSEQQQTTSKQAPVNNVEMPTTEVPTHPLTPSQEGELKGVGTETVLEAEISDPWEQAVAAEEATCAHYYSSDNNADDNNADDNNTETYVTDEEGRRYKDFTGIAARQEKEISEQEQKTVAAKLSEFISALSQKMKLKSEPQPLSPKNNLDALNQMLLDPVCRRDSSVRSEVNQYLANGYLADYDDAGYPIEIYKF